MKLDKYSENIIMTTEKGKAEQQYWSNKLTGEVIVSSFPKDSNHLAGNDSEYLTLEYKLSDEICKSINTLSNKSKYAAYMILLSGIKYLLYKYTRSTDIIIGMPAFQQKQEGEYAGNVLALRTKVEDSDSFKSLLEKIKNTVLEVDKNQNYPLYRTAELLDLQLQDNKYRFNTVVELEGIHDLNTLNYVNVDIKVTFSINEEAVTVKLTYDSKSYNKLTIDRIMKHYAKFFEITANTNDISLAEIDILSEHEKNQILFEFNNTKTDYPRNKTIQQLFEEQVEQNPDSIALVYNSKSLTYKELNTKANQLGRKLREKLSASGSTNIIGIMVERSIEMLIGILGILKAGAAYLPIDTEYPKDRVQHMIEDSKISILLTQSWLEMEYLKDMDIIELDCEDTYTGSDDNLDIINTSDDVGNMPAYIMYTSGSTGNPKGVVIEQKSVVRLVKNTNYVSFEKGDKILQTGAIVFDACTFEFWGALLNGLELHIIDKDKILEVDELEKVLKTNKITILWLTSSLFNKIAQHKADIFSGLRYLLAGGDVLSPKYINEVKQKCKDIKIVNGYGPTENTTFSTCHLIDKEYEINIPIGKPISNSTAYVVDKHNKLCPIGMPGELLVGGDGLAREYLNSPELTKEKFIENPFVQANEAEQKERLYRTGDLARWLPDGTIEFMGRIDFQVKIRGFRIELGEIEAHIRSQESIKEALVLVKNDGNGDKYLCAYYVNEGELSANELKDYLSKKMPQYMVPSYFVKMDNMPLTANGKIDRKALPEPDKKRVSSQQFIAPRNDIEEKVALVWQEVLGIEPIGIMDNFFELGGDSIKSIQVLSRLNKYRLKFDIKDLFRYRTIEALSKHIVKSEAVKIDQGAVTGEVELTPIQQWFFEKQFTSMNHWNQAVMLHGKNGFSAEIIEKVFDKLSEHHDALRMIYKKEQDVFVQLNRDIQKDKAFALEVFDLSNMQAYKDKVEAEVNRIQASIDLQNGPLVKLGLFKTMDGDHLLIAIHHLVIDGVSWRIIFEDFTIAYNQLSNNQAVKLQDKTHSFKTWAQKLKEFANSKEIKKEIEYWSAIEAVEVPALPIDKNSTESKVKDIETLQLSLTDKETEKLLKEANRAYNTEINDILLAALALTMKTWTKQDKVLVNLEGHGREEIIKGIDINRTVGWFTSQYPVILEAQDDNLISLIRAVKENLRRIPNKGVGHGILRYLAPKEVKESLGKLNAEVSFNYLGQFGQDVDTDLFSISKLTTGNSISIESENLYKLNINGMVTSNKLVMAFSYSRNDYNKQTIEGLMESYRSNLINIIEHCTAREKVTLTPADVGCKDLTVEQFDKVYNVWGDNIKSIYGLSPTQEGMLFYAVLDSESQTYFQQITFVIDGHIDPSLLEQSFNLVLERHDILRTNFIFEDIKRPLQVVVKKRQIKVHYEDVSNLDAEAAIAYVESYKLADKNKAFDLSKDILIRLSVIKYGEQSYKFIWSFHHIIIDGWCLGIINKELFEAYTSLKNNTALKLPRVPDFKDYIDWLEKQDQEEAKDYWTQYLMDYENKASIPQTKAGEAGEYLREEFKYIISKEITERINNIAKKNNTTPNIVLQSLWGIILQSYNNTNDVVFGAVLSGRRAEIEGVEDIVGLFINTVPVRVRSEADTRFADLLDSMQQAAIMSEKYSYYPLVKIQALSPLKSSLIDQIMVFENYPIEKTLMTAGSQSNLGFAFVDSEVFQQTNYDFEITMFPGEDIIARLTYNRDKYSKWFIEAIPHHIEKAVEAIEKSTDILVSEIEFIPEEEKQRLLFDFNNTKADYPRDKTVTQLFEEQVQRTPDNIAVVFEDKKLTYRELNERANQLARSLKNKGVAADSIVAIMVDRSLEMLVGIIAILKAGGAYLPIDPNYPQDRINFTLEDSEARIILSQTWLNDIIKADIEIINIDNEALYQGEAGNLENINKPSDLIYIIYTSGTTGKPKGVMLEHRNVVRLMFNDKLQFDFTEDDVWTMFHSFCFDFSVWEMYGALLYGGKLVVVPKIVAQQPKEYLELLKAERVTILNQTPTAFYNLINEEMEMDDSRLALRYIIFGGEALKPIKLKEWKEKYPAARLINMYGITETTVHVTFKEITEKEINKNISNIGIPIPTLTTYIMDKNMKLLPIGVPGELCVGGDGVARGYLNRPELTASKFIDNPYIQDERLYRSGDLVRMRPTGDMEYLGRIDHQVKIRGHRIELGEIENKLLTHKDIKEAVVLAKEDSNGNKYLCAYIVAGEQMTVEELRQYLSKDLPDYMIPAYFIQLAAMPLTSNGKTDKKALPEPDGSISLSAEYVAPRNDIEEKLAAVWSEVLGAERVGIKNSFFELGGDSIKAIQVAARMNKYQLKLNIKDLFQYNTIEELAKVVAYTDEDVLEMSLSDFTDGYEKVLKGKEIKYKGRTYVFKEWLNKFKIDPQAKELKKEKEYWNRLRELNLASIPADNVVTAAVQKDISFADLSLTEEETKKLLTEANKAYNTEAKDILLTALGLTIKEWTRKDRILVSLYPDEREKLIRDNEISKAVDWFTAQYPVILDTSEKDISYLIREQKEAIRRIPSRGIGYGILKHLEEQNFQDFENILNPEITFKYIPQPLKNQSLDADMKDEKLAVRVSIEDGILKLKLCFYKNQYSSDTIQSLIEGYKNNISMLTEHCTARYSSKNAARLTPYDIGCKELTVKEFDKINGVWKNKIKSIYPLTSTQTGMLIYTMLDKVEHAYFEQACFTINGDMDVELFRKSFQKTVERHDALRTNFIYKEVVTPLQIVIDKDDTDIYYEDITALEEDIKRQYIEKFKLKDRERGFDLERDTLIRLSVLKTQENSYEVVWSFHHIVMDGWCIYIINKDFFDIYYALKNNKEPDFMAVPEYKDYIYWLEKQDKDEARTYWSSYMESYEGQTEMPKTRINNDKYIRQELDYVINKNITEKLTALAKKNNVTIITLIQAIWGVLLQRYNNSDDVVFGLITSGRNSQVDNVEEMVGLFINTIPVRVQCDNETPFIELLARMQQNALEAENHSYYPLADILAAASFKGSLVDNVLFDHILVFENFNPEQSMVSADGDNGIGFTADNVTIFEQTNFEFSMDILAAEEIVIKCIYNAGAFDRRFIEAICSHIEEAANVVTEIPDIPISDIQFIDSNEIHKLLGEFNSNIVEFPKEKTVYQLFEEQVERTPDKIAVKCGQNSLTYRQLNEKANQLARVLRSKGLKVDQVVGIWAERSIEMLLGIMAVFKAGGAYLPIDPEYPEDRKLYMLYDSRSEIVLTQGHLMGSFEFDGQIINLEDEQLYSGNASNLDRLSSPKDLAYVIYTSGSTGRPKGAMVEHVGMVNHIYAKINDLSADENSIIAQNSSHCFDISVWQFLTALIIGGRTVIYPNEVVLEIGSFIEQVINDQITILEVVPSYLSAVLDYLELGFKKFEALKYILVTGETVKPILVERWFNIYPNIKMVNAYGPTEASDDITHYVMSEIPECNTIPIGKPVQNMTIYIVDEKMNLCPIGIKGEVCVSGIGVGRGYINDIEKTRMKFMEDPFAIVNGIRLYKTGDLGRWLEDGNIEFFGRMDYQVKIRGFRIELEEIEKALTTYPDIKEAVVVDRQNSSGDKYLCGYFVASSQVDIQELKKFLLGCLPDYMVPAYLMQMEHLPLTPNGKVNRRALPEPEGNIAVSTEYAAPTNEVEESLAAIWKEILGAEEVGIDHNFFELGGNSIKIITLVSKIVEVFNVELSHKQLFEAPTIRQIADILNSGDYKEQNPLVLLNGKTDKNVFLFPPIAGYGLIYKELADNLSDYSWYSFNYIVDDSYDLSKYVDYITEVQKEGPYVLFGWSSGGNLAFEVGRELEKQGYKVSDVIIIDVARLVRNMNYSKEEIQGMVNTNISAAMEDDFYKDFLSKNEFIRNKVAGIMEHYMTLYHNIMINSGRINANITTLLSTDVYEEGVEDTRQDWSNSTNGTYQIYQGEGTHAYMLYKGLVEENSKVIRRILEKIFV